MLRLFKYPLSLPPPAVIGIGNTLAHSQTSDTELANNYVINLAPDVYPSDFPDPISRPITIQTDPSMAPTGAALAANLALPNQKGILLTYAPFTVNSIEITGALIDDWLGCNAQIGINYVLGRTLTASVLLPFSYQNNAAAFAGGCTGNVTINQFQFLLSKTF